MSRSLTISGEDLTSLLRFLRYLKMGEERDGLIHMTANVPATVATPYMRAVMRREARLLTEDADAMGVGDREPRTAEQRRADAFADVMLSVANALRYLPHSG